MKTKRKNKPGAGRPREGHRVRTTIVLEKDALDALDRERGTQPRGRWLEDRLLRFK